MGRTLRRLKSGPLITVAQPSYGWFVQEVSRYQRQGKTIPGWLVGIDGQLQDLVTADIIVSGVVAVWLAAIAVTDLKSLRIPDYLSLPLVIAGLCLAWFDGHMVAADHLIGAGVGFLTMAVFGQAYFRLRGHEGLGLGDAKLFAAAGAWLGWQGLPLVLLVASVGGLAWAVVTRQKGELAFGPWLALGFWVVWLAQLF